MMPYTQTGPLRRVEKYRRPIECEIRPEHRTKSKTTVKWCVFLNLPTMLSFGACVLRCCRTHTITHPDAAMGAQSVYVLCAFLSVSHRIERNFYRILMHSNVLMASIFFFLFLSLNFTKVEYFGSFSFQTQYYTCVTLCFFACFQIQANCDQICTDYSEIDCHQISSNCRKRSFDLWREFKCESFVLEQRSPNPVSHLHIPI